MTAIDLDVLLAPVTSEDPCGADLEYDPEFGELERATQGRPEQQFGETIIPAEEPDWLDVQRRALKLLARSKDLRVATTLARAGLNTEDGLGAFSAALGLMRGYAERYWEAFHPRLDPSDDNDPTARVNILTSLCAPEVMLRTLKRAPLVSSRALGRFGLYHLAIANQELPAPPEMESPPTQASIEAAFMDADLEELKATRAAVAAALEHAEQLEARFTEMVGAARAASLQPLVSVLQEAERVLVAQLQRRGVTEQPSEAAGGSEAAATASAPPAGSWDGEIRSRQDVIRVLDKVCEYYERQEPSSPLPMLLRRAQRLATMSFLEILRELTPAGVSQAESLGGLAALGGTGGTAPSDSGTPAGREGW